jgi:hypothetical protein
MKYTPGQGVTVFQENSYQATGLFGQTAATWRKAGMTVVTVPSSAPTYLIQAQIFRLCLILLIE